MQTMQNPWNLTPRQIEVMRTACELGRDDEIADRLQLSKQTVKEHLMRARHLMGGVDMRRACVMFDRWDREAISYLPEPWPGGR